MSTPRNGAISACLLLSVTACSSTPTVVTETVYAPVLPPAALLVSTPRPLLAGDTNAHLLQWAIDLDTALGECTAAQAQLHAWRREWETP